MNQSLDSLLIRTGRRRPITNKNQELISGILITGQIDKGYQFSLGKYEYHRKNAVHVPVDLIFIRFLS